VFSFEVKRKKFIITRVDEINLHKGVCYGAFVVVEYEERHRLRLQRIFAAWKNRNQPLFSVSGTATHPDTVVTKKTGQKLGL